MEQDYLCDREGTSAGVSNEFSPMNTSVAPRVLTSAQLLSEMPDLVKVKTETTTTTTYTIPENLIISDIPTAEAINPINVNRTVDISMLDEFSQSKWWSTFDPSTVDIVRSSIVTKYKGSGWRNNGLVR